MNQRKKERLILPAKTESQFLRFSSLKSQSVFAWTALTLAHTATRQIFKRKMPFRPHRLITLAIIWHYTSVCGSMALNFISMHSGTTRNMCMLHTAPSIFYVELFRVLNCAPLGIEMPLSHSILTFNLPTKCYMSSGKRKLYDNSNNVLFSFIQRMFSWIVACPFCLSVCLPVCKRLHVDDWMDPMVHGVFALCPYCSFIHLIRSNFICCATAWQTRPHDEHTHTRTHTSARSYE